MNTKEELNQAFQELEEGFFIRENAKGKKKSCEFHKTFLCFY